MIGRLRAPGEKEGNVFGQLPFFRFIPSISVTYILCTSFSMIMNKRKKLVKMVMNMVFQVENQAISKGMVCTLY